MRTIAKALYAGAALIALGAGAASAADVGLRHAPPVGHAIAPPALPDDFSSGWYLRGDISGSTLTGASANYTIPGFGPVDYRNERFTDTVFGVGLGVGFKYKWARFDVTVDARGPARFSGDVPPCGNWHAVGTVCAGVTVPAEGVPSRNETFKLSSQTAMFNAYFDLGTWNGFTPYVGAGVGAARLQASNYLSTPSAFWTAAVGAAPGPYNLASAQRINFAWALMAGFSANITPNVMVDVGYRYLNMGGMRFNAINPANPANVFAYRSTAITAHEIRVGLRYMFGEAPAPVSAPVAALN